MKYIGKIVFYSTEKHKIKKMQVHFEINLYFMKLNFFN